MINHEIITKEFKAVLPVIDHILYALQRCFDAFFDLRPDLLAVHILPVLALKIIGEFLRTPHVALDLIILELGILLLNRVVSKMVLSGVTFRIILLDTKSDVTLSIAPNGQRVPISHEHPLPNIELSSLYNQGVLYTFLNNPKPSVSLEHVNSIDHLFVSFVHFDASTPGTGSRLKQP